MKFADLHCHNHSRSYLWLRPNRVKLMRQGKFNPWTIISSNIRSERKARMAASYGQCDLVKAWNGKVRLTFNALYPLEKGFFQSPDQSSSGKNKFLKDIIRLATNEDYVLRDILQMVYMKLPQDTINYYQAKSYDYWRELNEEMAFVNSCNGIRMTSHIETPGFVRRVFENRENRRNQYPDSLDAQGVYRIPKSHAEIQHSLNQEEITMVMTIEGAHALGTDNASIELCLQRVDFIKKNWPFPVFFITLAHHFNNFLCGHAHSIPDMGKSFLNQEEGMHAKFTEGGWKILRRLLSLDENLKHDSSLGYRILIDVKHMSAQSRKEYYTKVVEPRIATEDMIPVIASHCGYAGIATLQELIDNQKKEKDEFFDPSGRLNAWSINICKEDVEIIIKSKGLFGISFDQRILGVPKKEKNPGERNGITAIWDNIKSVLADIYSSSVLTDEQKLFSWKILTIGTDFEGLIDPINVFPSTLQFAQFRLALIFVINSERMTSPQTSFLKHLKNASDVERAVDDLCYGNAESFVLKHYMKK